MPHPDLEGHTAGLFHGLLLMDTFKQMFLSRDAWYSACSAISKFIHFMVYKSTSISWCISQLGDG